MGVTPASLRLHFLPSFHRRSRSSPGVNMKHLAQKLSKWRPVLDFCNKLRKYESCPFIIYFSNKVMNFGHSSHKTAEMTDCFKLLGPKRASPNRNRVKIGGGKKLPNLPDSTPTRLGLAEPADLFFNLQL